GGGRGGAAAVDAADIDDNDAPNVTYRWLIGATTVGTDRTLRGNSFSKDDTIVCQVTATDSSDATATATSAPVTIENTPPTVAGATITPSSGATESSTLTCAAVDAADIDDNDAPTVSYQWTVGGVAIDGNTNTLTGADFNKDQQVRCLVTVIDSSGATASATSNTVRIENTPPRMVSVQLPSQISDTDTAVTCSASANDDDNDRVTIRYEFIIASGSDASQTIDNGTNPTYRPGGTNPPLVGGGSVTCIATPNDSTASGNALSSNTVTITSDNPTQGNIIFVTRNTTSGNFRGLSGADALCNQEATEARLAGAGTFVALLSTERIDARSRLDDTTYITPVGTVVARSLAELFDGDLDDTVAYTAFGDETDTFVWTGTNPEGNNAGSNCNDWSTANGEAVVGVASPGLTDAAWIDAGQDSCEGPNALYCVQTSGGSTSQGNAFVTDRTYTANLGGLTGADAICNSEANRAELPGNYRALLSNSIHDAANRIEDRAYTMVDGNTIASNRADLFDGNIDNSLAVNPQGNFLDTSNPQVWTGTFSDGTTIGDPPCDDWSFNFFDSFTTYGDLYRNDDGWIAADFTECVEASYRLYCFEVGLDSDGDGLTDAEEIELDLDPSNPDTNGDERPDGVEYWDGRGNR
ncbi:MAG: DUF1554 domain-containing protein, partial [Myxococcota bacterium]